MINQLMHNVYLASLCSTFFASLFIVFRKNFIHYLGACWTYYLWFIIFIPWFSVCLPEHFFPNIDTKYHFHILTKFLDVQRVQHTSIHARFLLKKIIFMAWLTGALLYAIYISSKHIRFISLLKKNRQLLTDSQKAMVKNILFNISRNGIYVSTVITSPMICHIVKSKIYLPDEFFQYYTRAEQKYILQHEYIHYQRCDLIANTAMLILICLNWFNPVIVFSYRYFRSIQELSCDSILIQSFSSFEKKAYGYTLLKSVIQPLSKTAEMVCRWSTHKQLKERCVMLRYHHSTPIKNFIGLFMFLTAVSAAIAAPTFEKWHIETDLNISNSTKYDLSFSIAKICSDKVGIIEPHSVKVFSRKYINEACQANLTQCDVEVYSTANCSGNSFVTFIFDVTEWGVEKIFPHSNFLDIKSDANGFNIFFEGPWV
jgi:beta-lactamase regulating signal transducer with metallopeptidase domain